MNITVKYFGMLAEVTDKSEEQFVIEKGTVQELLMELYVKHPGLKEKDFKVAQNQQLVTATESISGAEIALLPPFSGG